MSGLKGGSSKKLEFSTAKCKLRPMVKNEHVFKEINDQVLLANDVYTRASLFLRLYCLKVDEVPNITVSTMRQCINCVSLYVTGPKCKDAELKAKFRVDVFSKIYPEKLDMRSKSLKNITTEHV